ncbi:MAG: neutral/alkaline non-lysosomal ceramidase N-terminal domain-containing protein [Planctomycetaceae bacterium]|nr:neutral/alkaline non-lysosomal ceramidase N-terminal domain-containing protein [Planctomycetaceae bacterium]
MSLTKLRLAEQHQSQLRQLPPIPVGAAVVDITPEFPIRLTGYGNRMTESEGVAARIHARALAFGHSPGESNDAGNPGKSNFPPEVPLAVLITVDNCGVPRNVVESVYQRLSEQHSLARERFAVSSTHTHSGPWLQGFAPQIFASVPDEHVSHLTQYEQQLTDHLVQVVAQAIQSQRPGRLHLGSGSVGFAMNRRSLQNGQWIGFGEVPDGPTDHRLPVLAARDTDGRLIAILATYACHATTETGAFNQISGDWPGFAADYLEQDLQAAGHSNAVALISIGCGADANPSPRGTHEQAVVHGRTLANEVLRVLAGEVADGAAQPRLADSLPMIDPRVLCRMTRIDLPHGPLPSKEEWQERAMQDGVAGAHARRFLGMLERGEEVPPVVADYPVQTWCFGSDLAMVFLGGEVVVDYAIRMGDMFDSERLWINAYSNDVPCYIASQRLLREGGYETDSSMLYYARPTRLAPEAEDLICDAVQKLLPHQFYSDALQADFPGPKSPEESLATITVPPQFQVELVAAEPLIRDPVAFDWDIQGRLWVAEMGDYPNGPTAGESTASTGSGAGRIQVLQDSDGDGRYDTATTFADIPGFPNGVALWRNGILVTAAPNILYFEDTDGDLEADVRTVIYSGFNEGNQQHRVNGMRWGLDGWLYLANGDSGGQIWNVMPLLAQPETPIPRNADTLNLSGRDLRIQPDTGSLESLSGQTQFGRERDDFGNWFGNNNSNPVWFYILEDEYIRRSPYATVSTMRAEIAETPGAAPVFPTSRTLARFNDFGAANRFTSACSTMVYRDHRFGEAFSGNLFTSEPVHNLVSRLTLERDGVSFRAKRAADEQNSEFFASSDNWTRPTMLRTGPDGALYVADMYRQVIEHPTWIPEEYQRKLDLRAGSNLGRIYRVVPASSCCGNQTAQATEASRPSPEPEFRQFVSGEQSDVSVEFLLSRLGSPNGWWRDTAHRILLHRGGLLSTEQLLPLLTHADPAVRSQALHVAAQLHSGPPTDTAGLIATRFDDPHFEVRRHVIRVLQQAKYIGHPEAVAVIQRASDDDHPAVRMQAAAAAGQLSPEVGATVLTAVLSRDSTDSWISATAFSSLNSENVSLVLDRVAAAGRDGDLLAKLIGQAGAFGRSHSMIAPLIRLVETLNSDRTTAAQWQSISRAVQSVRKAKTASASLDTSAEWQTVITSVRDRAVSVVTDDATPVDLRVAGLQFLAANGTLTPTQQSALLALLQPQSPIEIQAAVVNALRSAGSSGSAQAILTPWKSYSPALRREVLLAMLSDRQWTTALIDAIENGHVAASDIDAAERQRLQNYPDRMVQQRVRSLIGDVTSQGERAQIAEHWLQRIEQLTGNADNGRGVFEKRCATCHRLQDIGKSIGADLAALKDRSTQAMVIAILDPNRAVESKFFNYSALTTDGILLNGMLINEAGNSITLMSTDGKEHVIARGDLDELIASSRSLMPEGLEKDLSEQDLVDVITFVQSCGVSWKQFPNNTPRVIVPQEDGTLLLPASAAEVYGPSLIFEQKYGNLGWWTSTDDYAVWTVDVPASGHWTVEMDYACDNGAAGSLIKLSTGTRLLSARVPGSGTWDDYRIWTPGEIDLGRGRRQIIVTAPEPLSSALIDLRTIRLIPPGN